MQIFVLSENKAGERKSIIIRGDVNDETRFEKLCETSIRRRKLPAPRICIFEICRMHMQQDQMHSCFRDARHSVLLLRVFRVRSRPVKLHGCGRKTISFLRVLCCDINLALFVMNIQGLISNNQLSNALCDFTRLPTLIAILVYISH